jgi:uncharacterized protein YcfJ
MKQHEIQVGGYYAASISGKLVTVRVDAIRKIQVPYKTFYEHGRPPTHEVTGYEVTNTATGQKLVFRSAQKFRYAVAYSGNGHKVQPQETNANTTT